MRRPRFWRGFSPLASRRSRGAAALTISELVLGSAGAFALMRVLRARLVGVSELDPLVWTSAALILIVLVAIASVVPARTASRVNLVETLKVA